MAGHTPTLSIEEKRRKREAEKAARKAKRETKFEELSEDTLLGALRKRKKKATAAGRRGRK